MAYRLGIDIGGTFTDFVLADDRGETHLFKVTSNPDEPASAISAGLDAIAAGLELSVADLLDRCDLLIHGTTVVINALIQHSGAKTGLLCTEGFRDSLEIRLGYKEERYDFSYPPPPVLVPRYLRLPVTERVTKNGEVQVELDETQVRQQIAVLKREGVDAVAVSLLWSFLKPDHEIRIGQLLAEEFPAAFVSLSVDVLPQIREYERTSTTVINAYVGPILKRYIDRIEEMLRAKGFGGQIRYMQTTAGLASGEALIRKPIYAINSGPAAAPTAGLFFGRQLDFDNIITVDMGGTSFDVCLVEGGLPDTVKNVDVCRYRVGVPMININTVGAGGGSIARLDSGGILRVGPQSAEADPGPACYGRGGTEPTVTDANVILGYFSSNALLGGKLQIDRDAAREAVGEKIADPFGLTLEQASHGIFEVVNHSMTSGISEVSVERGYDPRDFALVVGGGAGPVHAGRLAAELGIGTVIIPKVASAFCAFGEVVADLRHDYTASYATRIRDADLSRLRGLLADMEHQGRAELAEEGIAPDDVLITRWLDMRYLGQVHECTISIPYSEITDESLDEIERLFHDRHESLYAYAERDAGVCELINLALTARAQAPPLRPAELPRGTEDPAEATTEERSVYFAEYGEYVPTPVYNGGLLRAGNVIPGSAIVEEPTTTIVVFPNSTMKLDAGGFYVMTFE